MIVELFIGSLDDRVEIKSLMNETENFIPRCGFSHFFEPVTTVDGQPATSSPTKLNDCDVMATHVCLVPGCKMSRLLRRKSLFGKHLHFLLLFNKRRGRSSLGRKQIFKKFLKLCNFLRLWRRIVNQEKNLAVCWPRLLRVHHLTLFVSKNQTNFA